MREKILQKAGEIFIKFGFKSVTMDDIANELGISKKTIYKYFSNKEVLVNESTILTHAIIHDSVFSICDKGFNAIQENFEIKKFFKDFCNNSDDPPMYQLQKYYPKTYNTLIENEFILFKNCTKKNIEKGISEGLYRKNIDIDSVTKFHFSLIMSLYDSSQHLYNKNSINKLEIKVLEYHIRAIATLKGLKILDEQLAQITN